MKPYAHLSQIYNERVFSYRWSCARHVVENAFGILHQRWRIFSTTLLVRPRVVRLITICACLLHNLQLQRQPPQPQNLDREDDNHNIVPRSHASYKTCFMKHQGLTTTLTRCITGLTRRTTGLMRLGKSRTSLT
ncbi:hypothetical protein E2C01_075015 [Portunus trituberculatus]|uniref:DDE Tnp4 domain-containing protein n=1 Tax=Portunus trituberculatus TaxID=210409 RepID=A0A5B7IDX2_PORTR|nr:hypothetical protein [Portunus trituberculatus]